MTSTETVILSQGTVQFRRAGRGKTIVLLHGLFLNGDIWTQVFSELSNNFDVIVPELPFGSHNLPMNKYADLSPIGAAKMLRDFIDVLNLKQVTVIGVDFGAVIAKIATARYGSQIERLVITNCDALEVFPAKGFGYLKWLPSIPGAMFLVAQSMYRLSSLRRGKTSFGAFSIKPIPDDLLKSFVKPMAKSAKIRRDAGKLMLGINKNLTLSLPAELRASGKSILVLWGKEDSLFTIDLARRLTKELGENAVLVELDNAKTFIAFDAPNATALSIKKFVT